MVRFRLATEQDAGELARLRWDSSREEAQAGRWTPVGDAPADGVSAAAPSAGAAFARGFAAFLQAALQSGRWAIWVAEDDDSPEEGERIEARSYAARLVGTIYVQQVPKVPRPGRLIARYGYVTSVYVAPSLRGRGLGGRLLERVIIWAREEQLEFLIVWPSEASQTYYRRAGFVRSAEALELDLAP